MYVRGGERIDPVRPRRPKLTRSAAKKFIHGAGEDILNAGQKVDDEAASRAREEHMKKHVSSTVLFESHLFLRSTQFYVASIHDCPFDNRTASYKQRTKKHCSQHYTPLWENDRATRSSFLFDSLEGK